MSTRLSCTRIASCTVAAVLLQILGLSLFVIGFFPVKPTLPGFSGPESYRMPTRDPVADAPQLPPDQLRSLYREMSKIPPAFDRLILMVVDGLPADFVLGRDDKPPAKSMMEAMPYTQSLLSSGKATAYHAKAAPPTVTMPRLKAIVSGAIGGFLDVAFNFNTQALLDDNLLNQFYRVGWKLVMLGDETWIKLFPGLFLRQDGVSSFYGLLTEEAMSSVRSLLPDYANGDLASLCSWPDEIRYMYKWRWTSPLHYIDTPDFKCNYDYSRDCHDSSGNENRCVAGAIYNYSAQLSTYQHSDLEHKYNCTEALLFLSHFVGDIHQPLHVGFTGDEGGNTIIVHWYRRKANLHHVWDNMIIDTALKNFYNSDISTMIQGIQTSILRDWSAEVPSWVNCNFNKTVCPNSYASESISAACKFAYRNATPGSTLGDEYFLTRLPLVKKKLAQGGVRLAATLNRIFGTAPTVVVSAA